MIELLIGISVFGFGTTLCMREKYEFFGIVICVLTFVFLLMHIPTWLRASYRYERHIVERNSIIESLETARENKNNIELTSITKDIIEYNKNLAILKFEDDGYLDVYIDDRMLLLKPIK
jgi:lipopolysaccharide export LptBFGC system permease protein LptF